MTLRRDTAGITCRTDLYGRRCQPKKDLRFFFLFSLSGSAFQVSELETLIPSYSCARPSRFSPEQGRLTPRIRLSLPQGVQAWLELPGSSLSTSYSYSSARSGTSGEEKRQRKEKKKRKKRSVAGTAPAFWALTSHPPPVLYPCWFGLTWDVPELGSLQEPASISKFPFPFSYSSKNGLWCQQSHCGWLHDCKGRPTLPVEARIVATPPQHSNAGKSTYIVSSSRGAHLSLSLSLSPLLCVFFFPFFKR